MSRRARPSQAPLSQEAIVSTALDLLSREGMAGLSLRTVVVALVAGPVKPGAYHLDVPVSAWKD